MKRSTVVFALFCMTLITGLVWTWGTFKSYFAVDPTLPIRLSKLEKEVEKQRFNNTLLTYQIKDYEELLTQVFPGDQSVLSKLAIYKKGAVESHDRQPASVDRKAVEEEFQKALISFKNKKFKMAANQFEDFQDKYPATEFNVKAYFFMAESYFLSKDYKKSMDLIDQMVTQYPDDELTGYILLRMGQMSEVNNQTEEAREVYKVVVRNFKSPELKAQAKKMLETVEGKFE